MEINFRPHTPEEKAKFDELLRLHTERYEKYDLGKNPFPLGGNYPDTYLPYTFLTEPSKNQIWDFLVSTFMRQEFNGLLVLGEYGSGKSHILHYIRTVVANESFFDKQALCFLIQNPSVAPADILLSMLREVKLSVMQDLIFLPVSESIKEQYPTTIEFLREFTNYTPQNTLYEGDFSPWGDLDIFALGYRGFVKSISGEGLTINAKKLQAFAREELPKRVNIEAPIIVDDLVELISNDDAKSSKSWESFLSSRIVSSKRKSLGTEYYLQAFLALFQKAGIRHVYLLIDEFEDLRTQRMTPKAAVDYLTTLRNMIQHNYRMFSLILACTRDAWNDLKLLYVPIDDRFPIKLDLLLSGADIKNVVRHYLQVERPPDLRIETDWAPFTEGAIDEVIQARNGVLRHVLTELRKILDTAASGNTVPPIDADFVRNVLSQSS